MKQESLTASFRDFKVSLKKEALFISEDLMLKLILPDIFSWLEKKS